MGQQLGERMRHRFGPRFRDSLRIAIRSRVDAARAQAEAARAAADAQRQLEHASHSGEDQASVSELIDRVRHDPEAIPLPPTDSFVTGPLTVPAKAMNHSAVATVNGDLDVYGMVNGNAIALNGNVILHRGAHVTGSAFAVDGDVEMPDGDAFVDGEIRSIQGALGPVPVLTTTASSHMSRLHAARLALAAFALVMLIGLGVLTFAEDQLDHVSATLSEHFGRAAWYGVVGQLALLPLLLAICVAFAITIVGIVLLPFAVAGFAVLAVGAATLGFMAVAETTGSTILRSHTQASLTPRGAQLRAIVTGIAIYGGTWVLTALVGIDTAFGVVIRAVVLTVSGVAVTVGFGAVLLWRFEVRRAGRIAKGAEILAAADAVWQTPTPVTGVAAARRPTPPAAASRTPE